MAEKLPVPILKLYGHNWLDLDIMAALLNYPSADSLLLAIVDSNKQKMSLEAYMISRLATEEILEKNQNSITPATLGTISLLEK